MAEIKHEDIVRAVRLAADIENAAMAIAQQEILINRLSAELKEAQSIAEQMLDIVLEKQKAEKSKAEPEVRITREAECVEQFADDIIEVYRSNIPIIFCRVQDEGYISGAQTMAMFFVSTITEKLKEFLKCKTVVKE